MFSNAERQTTPSRILTLLSPSHMPYDLDRTDEPSLSDMTKRAIAQLGVPFFLMVEGGRIDMACHSHDAASSARDTIAFDDAVRAGLEFAAKDGHTLVLVTADHATGGMAISEKLDLEGLRRVRHSAQDMLERAKGDAKRLREIVREDAGIDISDEEAAGSIARQYKYAHAGFLGHAISARLGVHFAYPLDQQETQDATQGHDASMVPIYAVGPGAERFSGTIDNTDIAKRIRELTGVGAKKP
jgi:alkaline phosphatase